MKHPEELINQLMTQTITKQDEIIVGIMKECGLTDIPMTDIVRQIASNGVETWSYKKKAFARMFPFEYKQVTDGASTRLIITQTIDKLGFVLEA